MATVADLGIAVGSLPSGPSATVLDVPGVGLGHATVVRDEPDPPAGRGVARTGVTVLLPAADAFSRPLPAGGAVLNGAGECTGLLAAAEWGLLESPVLLTSTMQLGRVYDAACLLLAEREEAVGEEVVIPVVAECDDSFLNDVRRMQLGPEDVRRAWEAAERSVGGGGDAPAGAPVDVEALVGSVGAGTGMSCLGFKGGIGTASRVLPSGHVLGVLLLTNFGEQSRLVVDGVPVGRLLGPAGDQPRRPAGSCVGVVVTDAPLDGATCARLARRVGLGLARTGSYAAHGSGEIFLACSTGARADRASHRLLGPEPLRGAALDPLFAAVVEAAEEAVLCSLVASRTTRGRAGHVSEGLPLAEVRRLLRAHGR